MTSCVKIQKRDGRSVDYDRSKIENAIAKANAEILDPKDKIGQSEIDSITNIIESKIINDTTVEDIQDMIEDELVKLNKYYLAKKYHQNESGNPTEHHADAHSQPSKRQPSPQAVQLKDS